MALLWLSSAMAVPVCAARGVGFFTLTDNSLSFWQQHKSYAAIAAAVLSLQAGLIVLLIWHYQRLRRANRTLRKSEAIKENIIESLEATVHRDTAAIEQAQQAVHESESRFRHIADAAPVLIWAAGPDKLCTYFNKPWLEFTGRSLELELGDGWAKGVHASDFRECLATYVESFDARREFKMEYRLRRFDGEYRWIFDNGVPCFDEQNRFLGYIGSCIDITERKQAEATLGDLSGRLLTAQEEERARIARELHDDVSQRMALLQIGLEELEQALPQRAWDLKEKLQAVVNTAVGVSNDIHELSHQLHPSKLETLGLAASLEGLCRELSQQRKLQVRFVEAAPHGEIPRDVTLCLFRIAQEALWNASKHSEAVEARVELRGDGQQIELSITDDGIGFDSEGMGRNLGIGLRSMQERVRLVGGRLKIESNFGAGTKIYAAVPVQNKASKKKGSQKFQVAGV
jgi:PAS domain S-box-containing protein